MTREGAVVGCVHKPPSGNTAEVRCGCLKMGSEQHALEHCLEGGVCQVQGFAASMHTHMKGRVAQTMPVVVSDGRTTHLR
jgi:hypothetical protein